MADAGRRRGARRVLRPDRRLRRPGRRARRGLPGGRARARGRGRRGRRRGRRPRTATAAEAERGRGRRGRRRGRRRRRGGPPDRVTHAARRGGARREPRDPARASGSRRIHAPDLASGSRAGQFVHVRTGDSPGLVLRRPFSLNTTDAVDRHRHDPLPGHRPRAPSGSRGCGRATRSTCSGRSGRPFEVDPRSRHLLLIAGGLGMAGVRMLADEAIRDGRQVTLLFGAASARARSTRRACCPTRSSTSSPPTTARSATTAS